MDCNQLLETPVTTLRMLVSAVLVRKLLVTTRVEVVMLDKLTHLLLKTKTTTTANKDLLLFLLLFYH